MRTWNIPPASRPGGTGRRLVLAWIAYHEDRDAKNGGKAEKEASVRHVQQTFRLSNNNLANGLLQGLKEPPKSQPWIVVSTPSNGTARGHHYRLGPAARQDADLWVAIGRQLFGPTGILNPYLKRPVLLRGGKGVGLNGCLTLAFIEHFGPVTQPEIVTALNRFMKPDTIRKKTRELLASEFVLEESGAFYTPRNLKARIEEDETTWGADVKAREIDRLIGLEQYAYQVNLLGGPTLARVKSMLQKMPCFYCGTTPPPEGGQYEHFPPVKWGGSDQLSLLLPICKENCNSPHGGVLSHAPHVSEIPVPPEVIGFPGTADEAAAYFLEMMMSLAQRYAIQLNERDVCGAMDTALTLFPKWIALKSGAKVINTITGEATNVTISHDMELIEKFGEDFGGIPGLLDERPPKPKKDRSQKRKRRRPK